MRTHFNPKNNPRVIIIQKLYGKFYNEDDIMEFPKHRFKKFIKDIVLGTIERNDLINDELNNKLGDDKRMQVATSQCHFLHLIIKTSNIKNVLEIGTFTGLSALSIALALPDDGNLTALDKNEETSKVAVSFFKKANQNNKIKTIVKPALESLEELQN